MSVVTDGGVTGEGAAGQTAIVGRSATEGSGVGDVYAGAGPIDGRRIWEYVRAEPVLAAHGLFLVVQVPLLASYFGSLWERTHYQFFPFVLAFVVWTIYREIRERDRWPTTVSSRPADTCLLLAVPPAFFHAAVFDVDFASLAVFLVAASGLMRMGFVGGTRSDEAAGGNVRVYRFGMLALPLAMIVRPPFNLDTRLISSLQRTTSALAGNVLDAVGVIHFRMGNVIRLPSRTEPLMVEEACSGVQGLFTLGFLAVAWAVLQRRSLMHSLVLLVAAGLWAVFNNMIRVTAICLADYLFGIDLVPEPQHAMLGYVCLAISAGLIIGTDQCLVVLRRRLPMMGVMSTVATADVIRNPGRGRVALALVALLVVLALPPVLLVGPAKLVTDAVGDDFIVPIEANFLTTPVRTNAERYVGWSLEFTNQEERDRSSVWGKHSTSWQLTADAGDGVSCHFSCDYPFTDWHELSQCYRGNGWRIDPDGGGREVLIPEASDGVAGGWPIVMVPMVQQTGARALLLFSFFDSRGLPVDPPPVDASLQDFGGRMKLLVNRRWNKSYGPRQVTYQVQAFMPTGGPLTESQKRDLVAAYRSMREEVRSKYVDRSSVADGDRDRSGEA